MLAQAEAALVEPWLKVGPDDLWSVLDTARLAGMSPGTCQRGTGPGCLLLSASRSRGVASHPHRRLRPLVDEGRRIYGPDL
jgi:hypothetical protein